MVSMGKAFKLFWKNYVNFTGASTRAEYWWVQLWGIIAAVVWVVGLIPIMALVGDTEVATMANADTAAKMVAAMYKLVMQPSSLLLMFWMVIGLVGVVLVLIPGLALEIRRYRDAGLATWAIWTVWGLSLIGGWLSDSSSNSLMWHLLVGFTGLFAFISFMLTLMPTNFLAKVPGIGHGQMIQHTDNQVKQPKSFTIMNNSDDEL
ncbi:DUF805 domain-containing protein [Weissella soli]|uniref:Uncharacterized membrane protein YhaH (DUF805 family) n=1 Tax=Weissella soli TaxID=155866 RepID=A0A288QL99_9LACO|nr:DUF805 domain-containing protein [Weissella soli]AOT55906.1 hypothetical protein WSWS_00257 [Weissella soli]MCT8394526.1 DUF805 domain-containing protein [Weissella soli]NKY83988.1 DUF805 domain-containing protein [Weissella soli]RDL01030.1 uncharacterized membrane protein YhaH (DUF805 family) [Weissella soli]GEN93903.1 hypothetical protein WSO01_15150 [Weissella soli]